jgi:sterol desaturase/sphingolipid hydroxylase (fatty acid hydroxylase superfamily)
MVLLKKTLKNVFINSFIVGLSLNLLDSLNNKYIFSLEELPTISTMLWQMGYFMIVEGFLYFLAHMIFHFPSFYWMHKQHHEYHNVVAISAQYLHPLESILGNILPIGIAFKSLAVLYPVHTLTIWTFIAFKLV